MWEQEHQLSPDRQRGTDALQTTSPPWHTQLLVCGGGMGPRRKASPLSDHSGKETTKSGSIFPFFFFFGTTISGCIGSQCMINARTLVKLVHPAAFQSIHK